MTVKEVLYELTDGDQDGRQLHHFQQYNKKKKNRTEKRERSDDKIGDKGKN